ncbi:hypothetical protein OA079_01155 [Candidatus Pelagibacter sp.]|nr:hypothetical protein [Candidatus Pelagibacter sp.]
MSTHLLSKKTFINFFMCIFALTFSSNAYCLENEKSEFGFYFGTKIYEERHPVDNSFFMSQEGWMIGINHNEETYDSNSYVGFKTRLAYGQVEYRSAGTGTMSAIPDYQLETTAFLGIPFEGSGSRTTLFSGLGFRYLLNASGLKLSSTGHAGYDRESRYIYLPIGANIELGSWEFRGEYLYFLYGQQTSYLSQVSANYGDITNDQEEGSGIKLTAKYYLDQSFGYEFYMDYWDIADSKLDVTGNFMEPRNTTSETGIRVFWKM